MPAMASKSLVRCPSETMIARAPLLRTPSIRSAKASARWTSISGMHIVHMG
jgi:hypothetical protein